MKNYTVILANVLEDLTLYTPDPDQVKPAYEKQLLADRTTPFPFWAKIWASSLALTSFLKKNPDLVKGKRVLEIGAGIGLPSFSIAHLAESVLISDHAAAAIALMEKNIRHLGLKNTKAHCLDWNHFPEKIKADVILLSDINYAPEQFDGVLKLIQRLLKQESTIIIATPQRIMATSFVEKLIPYCKFTETETVKNKKPCIEISILILSV